LIWEQVTNGGQLITDHRGYVPVMRAVLSVPVQVIACKDVSEMTCSSGT